MKKTLHFCFFILLVTLQANSQENYPGQVCSSAIQIPSIPYTTIDNTNNYGDDYDGTPGGTGCGTGSPYLNGDDVVYSFTATDNIPITITMTPTATWSGIFIYSSCTNIGVSCVAGMHGSNTTPRVIVLPQTPGQTYYIVISTWATSTSSQSTGYDLTIVKNSCTNFTATFGVLPDCANGAQFYATANVTNMGTASSIVATSNQGGSSQTITSNGTVQFGPYPNGTDVLLNLQNTSDPNCFRNSSNLTQAFCSATNNICSGAIPITCGSVASQTTVGASITGAPTFTCGTGPGSGGLWYSYIGTGDVTTFSLCGSAYDTRIQVFSGSCGNFSCVGGNDNSCNLQSEVTIISTLGTVYYVYVYGTFGSQGIFTLTTSCETPPVNPSNDNCEMATVVSVNSNLTCSLLTSGSLYGATPSSQENTCTSATNSDVWFQFVATQSIHKILLSNTQGATIAINHGLYTSNNATNPCTNLTTVYCSDPNNSYVQNLIPGQTYYIRVYGAGLTILQYITFDLCVSTPIPPINDEYINAITLSVNPTTNCSNSTPGTIASATQSPQPTTCTITPYDDVWYQFTATNQSHTISLIATTALYHTVYTSTSPSSDLTFHSCGGSFNSLNNFFVVGQTYYIRVFSGSNVFGNTATFNICVGSTTPPITSNTTQYTIPALIEEVLFNDDCTTLSNITWSTGTNFSSVNGIGYFEKNGSSFPFQKGIVLTTGNALNIPGPNTSTLSDGSGSSWVGDTQLEAIVLAGTGQTMVSYNATKIEFNFVPQNNFISFDFVFASDEYGTFQCAYADAFAFLLTDVATNTTTNLAVVPGTTTPISVITIRNQLYNSQCVSVNPDYFAGFYGTGGLNIYGASVNFNGITAPMTASATVIPNNLYKIKMVIADRGDTAYDSAVFIEGGSFAVNNLCQNVIKLEAFVDTNTNGIKDSNEPLFNQGTFNYTLNNATETSIDYSPNGFVYVPVENGTDSFDFNFQVYPEIAAYFTCTTTHLDVSLSTSNDNVYYFPVNNILPYNNVEVTLVPTFGPRPGFSYLNKIIYKNMGLTEASGTLTYTKDPALTINSISQTGTVPTANGFTYDYTNLAANETRTIQVSLQTPTLPTVALGDPITNTASATANADINLANNSMALTQIVSGSYDPNDKMESHGAEILFSSFGPDDYLYYTIRFQNTGTANAETVIITDVLNSQLDEQSIRMIDASHTYTLNRIGTDLEWTFDAINLLPITVSETASQGYVHFKIKPKPGYMVGDIIPNTAEIYFDFNDPIITNTFETEFVTTLANPDFTLENLLIYPNPTSNQVVITVQNSTDTIETIRLMDVLGKLVLQKEVLQNQATLDLSKLSKGVYMVEITTENQFTVVKKLIKN